MTTFDSTKTELGNLLEEEIQLPDFQRGWVWGDEHILSPVEGITRKRCVVAALDHGV